MPPKLNLKKEDCLKWFKNQDKNPITDRPIKRNGPHSMYHKIKEECEKYRDLSNDRVKSDKSSSSLSSLSTSSSTSLSTSSSNSLSNSSSKSSSTSNSSSNSSLNTSSTSTSNSSSLSSSLSNSKKLENILNDYIYYPSTNDKNFREKLNNLEEFNLNKYKKIKKINNIDDFNDISIEACPTNKFEKAHFQYFVAKYISNKTPYNSLLLYYSVGTGKTCAAILIAESILIGNKFYNEPNIYVILPKPLKNNFIKTIYDVNKNINNCTGNLYKLLSYKIPSDKVINQRYKIMTYYEFIKFSKTHKIENKTIIVDEAHNLRNPDEIDDENVDINFKKDLYNSFLDSIKKGKNNKLILMTGTPMYNQPDEIIDILNLLLLNDNKDIIKSKEINYEKIGEVSQKYISYINNSNPFIYGLRLKSKDAINEDWINSKEGIIKVELSKLQHEYFNNKDDKTNYKGFADFGPSNIVYNNKKENNNIYSLFNKENNKYNYIDIKKPTLYPDNNNLGYYAPKILKICEYVKKSNGIIIIYSRLVPYGILPLALALEHMGYNRYTGDDNKNNNLLSYDNINKNNFNYTILTSENNYINNIGSFEKKINLINSKENIDGNKIKVILITKKASEGLSFLNVREIHILDPWYHYNRFEQIIGRGIRRCSHINLPLNKRNIIIYIYCGYFNNNNNSVDLHALKIANKKLLEMNKIENIIKINAIDCLLNKNLNFYSKKLFKNLDKIEIINSQNEKQLIEYGDKNFYKCLLTNTTKNHDNINEENITIIEKYINNIKDIMIDTNYIHYDDLKLKLDINNDRYLDLAIKKSIYPNNIISKKYIYWGNNGLYKVNKNNIKNNIKEIILGEIIKNKDLNHEKNNNEKNNLIINYLKSINKIDNEFNLLFKIYLYINITNFYIIMKELLNNIDNYKNIIKIFKDQKLIIDKNNKLYYIDLFQNNIIKDNENNEVDIKIKFKEIVINNNNNYGSFNLNNIKNPKNIIFKIHNNSINNNNGAVCNTKTKTDILTIINNIDKSIIKDKMNKESLCQYLAYLYYINNNLKIVPYKKMIN